MSALQPLPHDVSLPAAAAVEVAEAQRAADEAARIPLVLAVAAIEVARLGMHNATRTLQLGATLQLEHARIALAEAQPVAGIAADDSLATAMNGVTSVQYVFREALAARLAKAAQILQEAKAKHGVTAIAFIDAALASIGQAAAHAEALAKGTIPQLDEALSKAQPLSSRQSQPTLAWARTALDSLVPLHSDGIDTSIRIARDAMALATEWLEQARVEALQTRLAAAMHASHKTLGDAANAFSHLNEFPDTPPAESSTAVEQDPDDDPGPVGHNELAGILAHYGLGDFCNAWTAHASPLTQHAMALFQRAAGLSRDVSSEVSSAIQQLAQVAPRLDTADQPVLAPIREALQTAAVSLSAARLQPIAQAAGEALDRYSEEIAGRVVQLAGEVDAARKSINDDIETVRAARGVLITHADPLRQAARGESAKVADAIKPLAETISAAQSALQHAQCMLREATASHMALAPPALDAIATALSEASRDCQLLSQTLADLQACVQAATESVCAASANLDHGANCLMVVDRESSSDGASFH